MSEREWKPGDVAMAGNYRVFLVDEGEVDDGEGGMRWHYDDGSSGGVDENHMRHVRPLVVIDPEDREQVERLIRAFADARATQSQRYDGGWWAAIVEETQAALVRLARPPEAFEHYPAPTKPANGIRNSLCGKVWKPKPVTIMGRCPECTAIVEAGWIA